MRSLCRPFLGVLCTLFVWAAAPRTAVAQEPPEPDERDEEPAPPGTDRDTAIRNSRPFKRWWAERERHGHRDPVAASRARAEADATYRREARRQPMGALTWESLGPKPILAGLGGASGRVSAVAVDPANASHWLIGGAQAGVWSTTDAGTTWVPRTDDQPSLAMGAIAFAPSNPSIVYAGTGEAHFSGDSYGGAGLLKSTDGGTSWTLLAADTFRGSAFSEIRVDPADPATAVAAVTYALGGEYATSPPNPPPRGVFRTTDGGVSWTLTLPATEPTDIEIIPGNFTAQYAGVAYGSGLQAGGIFRSFDGGRTWALVNGPWPAERVARVELAIAPSNPNRVFVSIDDSWTGSLLGLWRTDDAWSASPTWTQLDGLFCPNGQFWYDHDVIVDPQDANRLFHGGIGLCRLDGTTWTYVGSLIHSDQQTMAWAGNRLIVGNDGGVYSTTDGGVHWTNHNDGLALTQFYDGAVHPTKAAFALGGTQDNGTLRWTGSPGWARIMGADGGDCEISSASPDSHWAVTVQEMHVYRTRNSGDFQFVGGGLSNNAPFIGRLVKCPANDDVMVAGTTPLQRSDNFFSADIPTWPINSPSFVGGVWALEFAPSDTTCRTYIAGTNLAQHWLTTDGGATWRDLNLGGGLPSGKYALDFAFDPTNPNVLYVALSGFDRPFDVAGHLFKTTNALSPAPVFTAIGPPVDVPHNAVVVDPARPATVYVGTDVGVWRSTDTGASWAPLAGLPRVAVYDLQINATTGSLIAFTHGRGAWRLALAQVSLATAAGTASEGSPSAAVTVQVERSDGAALPQAVTVSYATEPGTAQSGTDYAPTSGGLTFPPGTPSGGTATILVPLIDDLTDEPAETFTLRLASPGGALLPADVAHVVTIADDDPPPALAAADGGTVEGDAGPTSMAVTVSLSAGSAFPITIGYTTEDGTASAGTDYTAATGVVTLPPGATQAAVPVAVVGDLVPEADETFSVRLLAPVNATIADDRATATILDDDSASLSSRALVSGSRVVDDLGASPVPGEDLFHLAQAPYSSYEIVVDAAAGDVQPLALARLAADGLTVLQSAAAAGAGGSWSLRWENTLAQPVDVQYARVRSGQCTTDCTAGDQYRARMEETTLFGPRFNNSGGQASVLILQNVTSDPVGGHQYYWSAAGGLLTVRPFSLGPRSTDVRSLPTIPGLAGLAGSLTVTHDGRHGALAGKLVAVEPASGLSFDTPLTARP